MSYHEFFKKKVVFKFPYRNKSCFTFFRAFELIDMVRLATAEEIKRGERIDENIYKNGELVLDKETKKMIDSDINFKKEVEDILELIKKQEDDLKVVKENLTSMIIDFFETRGFK
jgi:hypothetical protein